MSEVLVTPLTHWHRAQGAKMAPFAGWEMPIQYEGIVAEHLHTRNAASIFDICHMGEFLVSGPGARQALELALSHRLDNLVPGKCRYGFLLNQQGGVLDDLIVYCLAEEKFMLVVNAACAAGDFACLRERLPQSIDMLDISSATGKIDLQGPLSVDVLQKVLQEDFCGLAYFSCRSTSFKGRELLVSRTGYTGELGYELYCPAELSTELWEELIAVESVKAAGLGARDTLRLEAGLPLYGHELDEQHTPAEAGMGRMLTSTAAYVGREGAQNIRQCLVALGCEGRRAARAGDSLTLPAGTAPVGLVTSGSFAPSLGHAIAFAWVDKAHAKEKEFILHAAKTELRARQLELPFYTQGTARKKLV